MAMKDKPGGKLKPYTVIGIYYSNMQRHAESFMAEDATKAQHAYVAFTGKAMLIAGVVEGEINMVDEQSNAEWPALSDQENC